MPKVNLLNKEQKKEGNTVIVTKTVEEHLTRQDLFQAKQSLQQQKQGLLNQLDQLKERYDSLDLQDKEIDELLLMLEE